MTHFLLSGHLPFISPHVSKGHDRVDIAAKLQARHSDIRCLQKVKLESKKYTLLNSGDKNILVYRESNGEQARCVIQTEVPRILHRFHDLHGHFSIGVMSRNLLGRYYWPRRLRDVAKWCNSCEACQSMGPLHPSTSPKLVMTLQPMDMLGMDFLGPITPNSRSGSVYIIIAVDYFSQYLFAHATQRNNGETVVRFLKERIVCTYGWPLAFYVDNGSHFVRGVLPGVLKEVGTKLFTAPVSNLSWVGLSERYVQLVLAGLRSSIQGKEMEQWDEFLDQVVHAINTRVLKVHGFSPSQLFIGFNVQLHSMDESVVESMRSYQLQQNIPLCNEEDSDNKDNLVGRAHYETRLAALKEMRELTRERVMRNQDEKELKMIIPRYSMASLNDLVLRRRFAVDKSLGMKLHTRWDGPYRLISISQSGKSGEIQDLKMGKCLGKYAFNTLKVFVLREVAGFDCMDWVSFEEGLGEVRRRCPRSVDFTINR